MADDFFYDDRVPMAWAKQELDALPEWSALLQDRTYEIARVPRDVVYPYAYIDSDERDVMTSTGSVHRILKVRSEVRVVVVDRFTQGNASRFVWTPIRRVLMTALCGRFITRDVELEGEAIGQVNDADYQRTIEHIFENGDIETYHYGIAVNLIHI